MIQRPKPGGSEEDLLKAQKEFLAGKMGGKIPAAAVIKKGPKNFPSKNLPQKASESKIDENFDSKIVGEILV